MDRKWTSRLSRWGVGRVAAIVAILSCLALASVWMLTRGPRHVLFIEAGDYATLEVNSLAMRAALGEVVVYRQSGRCGSVIEITVSEESRRRQLAFLDNRTAGTGSRPADTWGALWKPRWECVRAWLSQRSECNALLLVPMAQCAEADGGAVTAGVFMLHDGEDFLGVCLVKAGLAKVEEFLPPPDGVEWLSGRIGHVLAKSYVDQLSLAAVPEELTPSLR